MGNAETIYSYSDRDLVYGTFKQAGTQSKSNHVSQFFQVHEQKFLT